ncbi:MAG TPA: MobA/MobL family protein [Allosphingosinicella sp.]
MFEIDPSIQFAFDGLKPFLLPYDEARVLVGKTAPFKRLKRGSPAVEGAGECASIDLRIPAMPQGRARNDAGGRTFHMACRPISIEGQPTLDGEPYYPAGNKPRQASSSFESYLGRGGAAELLSTTSHVEYIEREAALEAEKILAKIAAECDGRVLSPILSNIADQQRGRDGFWGTVRRFGQIPKTHSLIAHPYRLAGFWEKLPSLQGLPKVFHEYLFRVRQAFRDWKEGGYKGRFKPERLKVTSDEAGKYLKALDFRGPLKPVTFKSGPGGRWQYRMELELPHYITPFQRWWIMKEFCQVLGSYGLMYTAALHRPGDHGDKRNNHFHVIFSDRPAKLIEVAADIALRRRNDPTPPPGVDTVWEWDFAVPVYSGEPKNPKRIIYPFRQKKAEIVSQCTKRTGQKDSGRNFNKRLRRDYSRIVNLVLAAQGADYHYDPRRFKDMGIERRPTVHLGSATAALEADGIPTARGTRNAIIRYWDLHEELQLAFTRTYLQKEDAQKDIKARLRPKNGETRPNAQAIRQLAGEWSRVSNDLAFDRLWLDRIQLHFEQARSRAVVVAAAPDRHVHRTEAQAKDLKDRAGAGREHLSRIGEAWATAQEGLDALRAALPVRQAQVDGLLNELKLCLDQPTRSPATHSLPGNGKTAQAKTVARASVTPEQSRFSADEGRVAMAAAPQRVATSSVPPPPARDPSIDEERPLAAEAERQVQRLAAEDKERRIKVEAALDWARKEAVRVDRNGDSYFCWAFQQDNPPGIAALLKRPELGAIADRELKAMHKVQLELADALKKSPRIVFDQDGRVATESVPEALQGELAARASWPSLVAIAAERASALDQAAVAQLIGEVERNHVRVKVTQDGTPLLDAAQLSAESRAFVNAPRNRLMIGVALKPLVDSQSAKIERICDFISKHECSVDIDGKLKANLLPLDLQAAASDWGKEAEVAAAAQRWVRELEKIVAKLRAQDARRSASTRRGPAGEPAQVGGQDRQAAPAEDNADRPAAGQIPAAAGADRPPLVDDGPSAEDWDRLAAEVLRRELSPSEDGKSVRVEGLERREKAILTHKKFAGEFLRRLSAAVEEIDRAFKLVLGDLEGGRIRFTTDGVDLSRLMPEEAALVERHKHRVRIENALDAVRKRREEDEEREYQELLTSDALYRAGKGPGR